MGFSHAGGDTIWNFHEQEPAKPLVMSECCSCETQRGEDEDLRAHRSRSTFCGNENSGHLHGQVSTSDAPEWMAGTYGWTRMII